MSDEFVDVMLGKLVEALRPNQSDQLDEPKLPTKQVMFVARNTHCRITNLITKRERERKSTGKPMTDDFNRGYHDHEHAPSGPHIVPAPPAPPISKDVYLADKTKFMPLYLDRFTHSVFLRIANNEQLGAAFRLWIAAWGERPAGSVPNDRRWLADVTKLGDRWSSHAEVVLHGFVACNDGRLYHPVICEIARKRVEQLQGRQRGAALSRKRQLAKRENRRKNARRLAASLATTAADEAPPF